MVETEDRRRATTHAALRTNHGACGVESRRARGGARRGVVLVTEYEHEASRGRRVGGARAYGVERATDDAPGGCFLSVASAAGLLTQLGSPTYSVTKHAAVGFAEWLAATYGDRGVQVTCACPMGVRTAMLEEGETSADADARLGMRAVVSAGNALDAAEVAAVSLDAVESGAFQALPHPEVATMWAQKASDVDR